MSMNECPMAPLQWTGIPHINQIEGISAGDRACLAEIRDVLMKHQRLNKFGVALLHHHFSLGEDEILVEHCDTTNRTLTVRVMRRSHVDRARLVETIWRFDSLKGTECPQVCPTDNGEHCGPEHANPEPTPTPTPTPTPPPAHNQTGR